MFNLIVICVPVMLEICIHSFNGTHSVIAINSSSNIGVCLIFTYYNARQNSKFDKALVIRIATGNGRTFSCFDRR